MDFDSEFELSWNTPKAILDSLCKILILILFGALTCFEIVFCGRWRDFLPPEPVDTEAIQRRIREFRREYAPVPLPAVRKRALSLAEPVTSAGTTTETAVRRDGFGGF